MKSSETTNVGRFAAQFVAGAFALALLTLAFSWLHADVAIAAFACLVVILLSSLVGNFTVSILLSILAAAALGLFFMPPLYHFEIDHRYQLTVILIFFLASLIAARLVVERKRTEIALQRSEAFLAQAQELSKTGSFGRNTATDEILWSRETFRIYDYDPATKLTMDLLLQRTHPADRDVVKKTLDRAFSNQTGFSHHYRLLMPNGSVKYLFSVARAVKRHSGALEFIGAVTDVTVAKEAEQKLLTSEQRFRDYAETVSGWFWESGPDHRITSITDYRGDAGNTASRLVGHHRWEFASDAESEPEKWQLHRATLNAHLPFRDFVYRTQDQTGHSIYLRISGKPIFDTNGEFLGYRGVTADVTAAVRADQAEQALHRAQLELAHVARVTTLGELTASIAHEINQPLTAIISNADACINWLHRDPPDLEAARRSMEWITDNANRAGEVIKRVRALAKNTEIEKVPLDINDVVQEVIVLIQRELAKHAVSARTELAPLSKVLGDRIQLQQVMLNLMMNGIEAMESIVDRPRELVVRSKQDGLGGIIVSVTDCGVGIEPEIAERLFNPFFTTKSSGMGIGLSICRSILESHGGRLSAANNDGPGATFRVALPTCSEQ